MESDDSSPCPGRKKRLIHFDDTSSDSDSDFGIQTLARRNRRNVINHSDSSSVSSIDLIPRKKSKPAAPIDSDTSSSGSDIVFKKRSARIPSDDDSYESDWSATCSKPGSSSKPSMTNDGSSSDSDGQSDKCPICLISFKNQEVGSPESCDHSFCAECILEWSKNVNTCPVDRQPFTLVLVRSKYNGKVIRQVPIEPAAQQNNEDEVVDDPTFCEICGSCDREDRLLLCDGCDLGFHLECLTPPLEDVPTVAWYCSDCDPDDPPDISVYLEEVQFLLDGAEDILRSGGSRRRNTRLVPRTRQSERVRSRIMTNRTRNRTHQNDIQEEIQVVVSQNAGPSTSRRRKKMTKTRKSSKKSNIKIIYDLDKDTGQQIVIETKTSRYKRKKKKSKKARVAAKPKTVKKRLAVQLGMCTSRSNGQSIPDVRVSSENSRIGFQRSQAAIPALHLFGRRQELDYFSDSEIENNDGGVGILTARRPNMSDVAMFRRSANRKNILIESSSASCDLLGSIMDSQEKFHSKNTVLSLRNDGTIQVNEKGKKNYVNNNSNERINLNDYSRVHVRHTPLCSDSTSPTTGSGSPNQSENYRNSVNAVSSASTISNDSVSTSSGNDHVAPSHNNYSEQPNYSVFPSCSGDIPEKKNSDGASPQSESELDLYSDIETVSTSKAEDTKTLSPPPEPPLNMQSDDEANNSDTDLVIDTEKADEKSSIPEEFMETKEEAVSSTTNVSPKHDDHVHKSDEEDADSEDGCPNFSIYSAESINLAKSTDVGLLNQEPNVGSSLDVVDSVQPLAPQKDEMSTAQQSLEDGEQEHPEEPPEPPETPEPEEVPATEATPSLNEVATAQEKNNREGDDKEYTQKQSEVTEKQKKINDHTELYSDSDDEIVKVDAQKPFGIGDIRSMTEDISEEERSYTPCLDERAPFGEGLEGLDTEAISDEEKNDFDESHELKTASDGGDALEINAKECELDFSKPEEYEEGEIIDKLKKLEEAKKAQELNEHKDVVEEQENQNKEAASFKKISKSNKDRNYRDKERGKSRSASKENERSKKRDRKKEKRKEIERYNIRTVLAEKPRRMKDKFGRDRRSRTKSSRSRSASPQYRSVSRGRRSHSREKSRKRRPRTTSRSRSRRRSRSRHRRRSLSKTRPKKRRSRERSKNRRKNRSTSRRRSRSNSPKRRRDWERRSRGWSPSPSRSRSPMTPSWTPPRLLEKQPVKPHNLTVILTNDSSKKKKDRKRGDKKKKDNGGDKQKKRKRDKTPPPSKEVFASGDNILVSVSFNDEREREATVKRKRDDDVSTKRTRKEKTRTARSAKLRKKKRHDLSGVKPVAIIDLDRSPFKELTPSPKDVIILTDSENGETRQDNVCDSSQQADPYPTGPKTPPEPQVKFSLTAKPAQLRAITNPLHEPDDMDGEMDPQEELEQRLTESLHKGPNTPPEPPNSPPSSPDAYDPFDPTKSRSPTPENISVVQSSMAQSTDNNHDESSEILDKSNLPLVKTPDVSHTPPVVPDVQPADSQSNGSANTPEINGRKSPERSIAVVINQVVQSQPSIFPTLNKSVAQTSYSSAPLVTSTPISTNLSVSRINILNSTILAPVMSSVPQRIVLPTTTKSSPIKVSPTKPPIKSTPIKPMPNKSIAKTTKTPIRKTNARNNNDGNDSTLEFDSPYSPGPSDYEDLFEPPSEPITKASKPKPTSNNKSGGKNQNTFDALFGSSPVHKSSKSKTFDKKKKISGNSKTKMVGVKIDEDSLKILDDVPNSAVEMQVKDKFLKKLNRQERVVEEVKLVLKPHYNKKHINKEEYKDILRRAVPKICHNRSGEINPKKIQNLIEAYVKKVRHSKKVTSSSSVNPQKAN